MAVWNGLVCQRRVDDAVTAGLEAAVATEGAAVELFADAVRSGAAWLDDAIGTSPSDDDDSGPAGRIVDHPLDSVAAANATVGDELVDVARAGFDRYESGLRAVLLALNRRISALLDKHEALEARLREYVERSDEAVGHGERVEEFRSQLAALQSELRSMQATLLASHGGPLS